MGRRGWIALCLAAALGLGGRILGAPELYVLAAAVVLLVVLGVAYVRLRPPRLEVARRVHPRSAQVGSAARIDLEVRNAGSRRSGLVTLDDAVSGTRGASVLVPPLRPGRTLDSSYSLPTQRRGVLRIGPLLLTCTDPFELASATSQAAGTVEVTVFPHVDRVEPTVLTTGNDPLAGSEHPDVVGRRGDDFYALRPYVVGDDLRRVHWRSTARHDDLMIRQEEIPWQGRVTVLLDNRPRRCSPEVFERMVSAAASVVAASGRRQDLLRLVTTQGSQTCFGTGHRHVEAIMEQLATVEADDPGSPNAAPFRFDELLGSLDFGPSPGALVALVGELPLGELTTLARAGAHFGAAHLVRFLEEVSPGRPGTTALGGEPVADVGSIDVAPWQGFAATWNESMARPRPKVAR